MFLFAWAYDIFFREDGDAMDIRNLMASTEKRSKDSTGTAVARDLGLDKVREQIAELQSKLPSVSPTLPSDEEMRRTQLELRPAFANSTTVLEAVKIQADERLARARITVNAGQFATVQDTLDQRLPGRQVQDLIEGEDLEVRLPPDRTVH